MNGTSALSMAKDPGVHHDGIVLNTWTVDRFIVNSVGALFLEGSRDDWMCFGALISLANKTKQVKSVRRFSYVVRRRGNLPRMSTMINAATEIGSTCMIDLAILGVSLSPRRN